MEAIPPSAPEKVAISAPAGTSDSAQPTVVVVPPLPVVEPPEPFEPPLELLPHGGAQRVGVAGGVHQSGGEAFRLFEQGEQQMLGIELRVAIAPRKLLRRRDRLLALNRELVEVHVLLPASVCLYIG